MLFYTQNMSFLAHANTGVGISLADGTFCPKTQFLLRSGGPLHQSVDWFAMM